MKWLTFDVTGAFLQCTWTGEPLYIRLPNDTPAETVYMGELVKPGGRAGMLSPR